MKINFGCGDKKLAGYVNVDICGEPDVRTDLSKFPWPFESECADEVYSEHFLEHVKDFESTIFELHRILKPDGILHFKVPISRALFSHGMSIYKVLVVSLVCCCVLTCHMYLTGAIFSKMGR